MGCMPMPIGFCAFIICRFMEILKYFYELFNHLYDCLCYFFVLFELYDVCLSKHSFTKQNIH